MSATHNSGPVATSTGNSAASGGNNGSKDNGGGGSRPGTPCSTASGETNNNLKASFHEVAQFLH